MPAARVGDMHVCPMVTPGIPPIPHVGGPVMPPGKPTVLIGKMPAATVTNMCTCVGPPDFIVKGSTGVFIGKLPAARMGDTTAHGGSILIGCPTVLIGETSPGGGAPSPVVITPIIAALRNAAASISSAQPGVANQMNQEANHKEAAIKGSAFVHAVETCSICSAKNKKKSG